MRLWICISAAILAVAMMLAPALPGSLTQCEVGQLVEEDGGPQGQIVGERNPLCLVRSNDGRMQSWIPADRLSPAQPAATEPSSATQSDETEKPAQPAPGAEKAEGKSEDEENK